MKTTYLFNQSNYLPRTAIGREQKQFIKITFAVHLSAVISAERYRSDSGTLKSAVLTLVYFYIIMIVHKCQQSAKTDLLLNNPTDRTFENRWSRYKEPSKNKAEAYRVYVEHLFLRSDAGGARIFSKEEDVYGIDYGFGLDAPKETEQTNPQDLFAYRRNYTWTYKSKTAMLFLAMYNNFLTQQALKGLNEKNLLTKSSDKNYTVHYRYGEDGQRALKYTEEGRSETLYFNNFFTIHIPIYDKDNPQGLRVHKHIFVGNSRLVTAMTHTDNHGDNDEQKEKRYYYHSDHLGSAQFVTDWRGKQYEHIEYTPYGELWIEEVAAGLDKLPFRFTGKELDEETGLYYYGARYLDPKYSRWLAGDPALNDYIPKAPIDDEAKKHNENLPGMGGVFNIVNLHLYHYAGNNPIKYIDPDGRNMEDDLAKSLGATSKKQGVDLNLFTANPKQDFYDESKPEFGNMRQAASRAYKYAAFFYVATHGNRDIASSCGTDGSLNYDDRAPLSPEKLAEMIKSNPNYNGQPVVLWICNSGQDPQNIDNSQDCFAKKVADALGEGALVIASTGFVNFKSGIFIRSNISGNRKTSIPYTSVDTGEQYKFIGGK